jgi:hypothetical protein
MDKRINRQVLHGKGEIRKLDHITMFSFRHQNVQADIISTPLDCPERISVIISSIKIKGKKTV